MNTSRHPHGGKRSPASHEVTSQVWDPCCTPRATYHTQPGHFAPSSKVYPLRSHGELDRLHQVSAKSLMGA